MKRLTNLEDMHANDMMSESEESGSEENLSSDEEEMESEKEDADGEDEEGEELGEEEMDEDVDEEEDVDDEAQVAEEAEEEPCCDGLSGEEEEVISRLAKIGKLPALKQSQAIKVMHPSLIKGLATSIYNNMLRTHLCTTSGAIGRRYCLKYYTFYQKHEQFLTKFWKVQNVKTIRSLLLRQLKGNFILSLSQWLNFPFHLL